MSDETSLGDAVESKKERRNEEGAEEASRAALEEDWDTVGLRARKEHDRDDPRRQMNVSLPPELKRRFKGQTQKEGLQIRFVVEDLIRMYLDRVE